MKCCALIPSYNHYRELPRLMAALVGQGLSVLVVDDGSEEPAHGALAALAAENPDTVRLLHFERNRGKGAAVLAGMADAAEAGYTHVLQIDADGQHDPRKAGALLAAARRHPDALISATPVYDETVPPVRYYGRWITHLLVWLETCSRELADSMCGFRVYPLAPTLALARRRRIGARMDFDTDVMVHLYLAGTPVRFLPVPVRYAPDGLSNYRMLRDNLRMTRLHLALVAGLPPRLVGRSARRLLPFARPRTLKE